MWVTADDVRAAHEAALRLRGSSTPPGRRARWVGGTGMSCLGFKGGIGTSSRVTPGGHTVAVVLMTNFGERDRLTVDGVPVGRLLPEEAGPEKPAGSCIGVVVTDAPVDPAGCERLARRVGLGLARTGSTAHHGSGEIFLAASTTARTDRDGTVLDDGRRLGGRAARRPLRGGRRRGRGVGAQLAADVADHGRPGRQHQRGARPRHRRPAAAGARPCR